MPTSLVKKYAKKLNLSIADVEKQWIKSKKIALNSFSENDTEYWKYVVSIFKKQLGIKESKKPLSYKQFMMETVDFIKNNPKLFGFFVYFYDDKSISSLYLISGDNVDNISTVYNQIQTLPPTIPEFFKVFNTYSNVYNLNYLDMYDYNGNYEYIKQNFSYLFDKNLTIFPITPTLLPSDIKRNINDTYNHLNNNITIISEMIWLKLP